MNLLPTKHVLVQVCKVNFISTSYAYTNKKISFLSSFKPLSGDYNNGARIMLEKEEAKCIQFHKIC